jgi:hypothetical protein
VVRARRLNSSRKARIIAGGQAAPPTTVRFNVRELRSALAHVLQEAQPHGRHAAEYVTFSCSKSSCSDLPSNAQPGNTSLAPTSGAAYAIPQPLAWNMGTTGSTLSREERLITSGSATPYAVQHGGAMAEERALRIARVPEV